MSVQVQIVLPPDSEALIKRFSDMPEELPKAIKRGMDRALQVVAGRVQLRRLTGRGPFPPAEHRLGVRTGQLRQSVRATPAVIRGNEIEGAIGTPVIYGRVHEFGFQGTVRYKSKGTSRLAAIGGRSASGTSSERQVNIPERAPFRTGIGENKDYIAEEIAGEIKTTAEKKVMTPLLELQNEIVTWLSAPLEGIPAPVAAAGKIEWITEIKLDLKNAIDRALGGIGIIGIVMTPFAKLVKPGHQPISLTCPIEIQIQENVNINQGSSGTQIAALELVTFCMKRIHWWSPPFAPGAPRIARIMLDDTPFLLVSEYPVLTYNVRFNVPLTIT